MVTGTAAAWPRKTRELHTPLLDSSVWNDFRFRRDDVVIATYAKAGTTWTQQIVAQLIFGGRAGIDVASLSPWLDLRMPPKEVKLAALEAQRHRRFIKTHLPVDALVFSPAAKYIYIGRDGRDVVWSLYNHHANVNEDWYRLYNNTPGRVGPRSPGRRRRSASTSSSGSRATDIPSGRSGTTSRPGGRSGTCRTCCSYTSPTSSAISRVRCKGSRRSSTSGSTTTPLMRPSGTAASTT
jgi:Sulfotransferase domain